VLRLTRDAGWHATVSVKGERIDHVTARRSGLGAIVEDPDNLWRLCQCFSFNSEGGLERTATIERRMKPAAAASCAPSDE
jgi:hypothetical protein